jgi:N-acetylglucosamine kinase-like BadF-type ATPase
MSGIVFAGVDGGGTKTEIVLVDEDGSEVARHVTTTSNAAVVGHETAGMVLSTGLVQVLQQASGTLAGAWLGLSGGDRPEDHRRLRPHIEHLTPNIRITNDAELVLAALPNSVGLVVVAGTGSIAFGRSANGTRVRSGGWGQLLGDEGSGYDLARRMLVAFTDEVDGRGGDTMLTPRLMAHLDLQEPFQLIQWVYARDRTKGDIAGLSSIVLAADADLDEVAMEIVNLSSASLARTAAAAAARLALPEPLPMALTGGLLVGSLRFRSAFLDELAASVPSCDVRIITDPALAAAQAMAATFTVEND